MKGLVLVFLFASTAAYSQTAQQVSNAFEAVRAQDNVLQVASENLGGMAIGADATAVGGINHTVMLFMALDGIVIAVGNLLPKMHDTADANHVRIQLHSSLGSVLEMNDVNIKYVNGAMTLLKSPAALAEATKARDAMVAIQGQLRALST